MDSHTWIGPNVRLPRARLPQNVVETVVQPAALQVLEAAVGRARKYSTARGITDSDRAWWAGYVTALEELLNDPHIKALQEDQTTT